jgi:dCMP deaminase
MDWHKTFLKIAVLVSEHSKCSRLKVASLIVKDNRILSTGINGTPPGTENCQEHFKNVDITSPQFYHDHHIFSEKEEIHSEINAILFAAKNGVKINDTILYITISPCMNCAKAIITAGIKEVYYIEKYDRNQESIEYLTKKGIKIKQINLGD